MKLYNITVGMMFEAVSCTLNIYWYEMCAPVYILFCIKQVMK